MSGLGTDHVRLEDIDVYVPEIWQLEVIADFMQNLVLANRVTRYDHTERRGDTIHVPNFTRGDPSQKSAETQVVNITGTESEVTITINQHWHYARTIEDIAAKQALPTYRQAYTQDAGYSLARLVDRYLFYVFMGTFGGSTSGITFQSDNTYSDSNFGSNESSAGCVIGGDGATTFDGDADNATDITDEGIRQMMFELDEDDVPEDMRTMIIPPIVARDMRGIARFTEQAFVGEAGGSNTIRTGVIGDLYGVPVYKSSNCPLDQGGSQDARMGILFHQSAVALATQIDVRTQSQYKLEWLSDLFVADHLFGASVLRSDAAIPFAVPAS